MPIVLPGEPGPLPIHLRRPFTPGDPRLQRAYAREVERILRASIRGTEQDLRRVRSALVDLNRDLRARLATEAFQPISLPTTQRAVEAEILRIEAELQLLVQRGLESAAVAGQAMVQRPLMTILPAGGFTSGTMDLSAELVDAVTQHSADLIAFNRGGLSARLLQKVNGELHLATLGARSGVQAIRNISGMLGQGGRFTHEAERIYRTEVLRMFSMSSQATMEQVRQVVPSQQKAWIWSRVSRVEHAQAQEDHGPDSPIPVDQPFLVAGEKLMFPRDPAGSAANTINCTCFMVPVIGRNAAADYTAAVEEAFGVPAPRQERRLPA